MVKQADKTKKRSPLVPILGLFLAIGFLVIAFMIAVLVIQNVPQVHNAMASLAPLKINNQLIPIGDAPNGGKVYLTMGHVGFTIMFWFVLAALGYFLVTIAAGKDPESAKNIPLPTRDEKKVGGRRG